MVGVDYSLPLIQLFYKNYTQLVNFILITKGPFLKLSVNAYCSIFNYLPTKDFMEKKI